MDKILVVLSLFFTALLAAQDHQGTKELTIHQKEVKQAIEEFFDGFHKGDTAIMKKVLASKVMLKTVAKNKEGKIKIGETPIEKFLNAIHNRPADQKWDERLLSFTITANGQIANAWTPYEFYFNEKFSHCGVNVFQLYKDREGWKIMHLADTRNREGCKSSGE